MIQGLEERVDEDTDDDEDVTHCDCDDCPHCNADVKSDRIVCGCYVDGYNGGFSAGYEKAVEDVKTAADILAVKAPDNHPEV